jgi:hypothetical protein
MIRQLEQCWVALNPPKAPAKPRKAPAKAKKTAATPVKRKPTKARATSPADSVTSEEVPLANQDEAKVTKKKKEKVVKPPPMTVEQLYQVFQSMLTGDNEVYSRLLRYEVSSHRGATCGELQLIRFPQPLPFDELIGMGTEKGITKVGWKKDLRKYLDEQVSRASFGGLCLHTDVTTVPSRLHSTLTTLPDREPVDEIESPCFWIQDTQLTTTLMRRTNDL